MEISRNDPDKLDEKIEKLRKQYLQDFIDFRKNYLDDLPVKSVSFQDPNYYKYKCRMTFFVMVAGGIDRLITNGAIADENVLKKAKEFLVYMKKGTHRNPRLATKEDINIVNEILDIMIAALS